jgi:hypothetical protein
MNAAIFFRIKEKLRTSNTGAEDSTAASWREGCLLALRREAA